jgi:hypothetical protein
VRGGGGERGHYSEGESDGDDIGMDLDSDQLKVEAAAYRAKNAQERVGK